MLRPCTPRQRALVEKHYPLVLAIARRMAASTNCRPRMQPEDLAGDGVLGLIDAVARFRPGGLPFRVYAARRITGAMIDGMRRWIWGGTGGARQVRARGETPRRHYTNTVSVSPDASRRTTAPVFVDEVEREDECGELLGRLPRRWRQVLELTALRELTLTETGRRLGISDSRACQLRRKALRRLREAVA